MVDCVAPVFAERRRRFAQQIQNGILFLAARESAVKSRDVHHHPYSPDRYLYYLTGCAEPEVAFVLDVESGKVQNEILFCRPADPRRAQWDGDFISPRDVKPRFGIAGDDIRDLGECLADIGGARKTFYTLPGEHEYWDNWLGRWFARRRLHNRRVRFQSDTIADAAVLLDEMRLVKDESEIIAMQRACDLTVGGILEAMRAAKSAAMEYEIEALLSYHYRRHGAGDAFPAIVAGGANACCLHYKRNDAALDASRLLLIDTGAEMQMYCGDLTRTFPVSGKWSAPQRDVYDIVLAAQEGAVARAVNGASWKKLNETVIRELAEGMRTLGLLDEPLDDIIESQSYKRFYMHGIGHSLGLDVHDVGVHDTLRAGMVVTIEPGLYIPDDDDIPAALRGIGVRIEDNVLIEKSGNRVLSAVLPKAPDAISDLIAG